MWLSGGRYGGELHSLSVLCGLFVIMILKTFFLIFSKCFSIIVKHLSKLLFDYNSEDHNVFALLELHKSTMHRTPHLPSLPRLAICSTTGNGATELYDSRYVYGPYFATDG